VNNMRFVGLWHVRRGDLETAKQCHVCEGIFASAFRRRYGNRHFDFSIIGIIFLRGIILNPMMNAPHIRPNVAQ
jgi:hypothetical protein